MTLQPARSDDPLVFAMSLSWVLFSVVALVHSIRMEGRIASWFWAVSFAAASVIAVVFFWRIVRGGA